MSNDGNWRLENEKKKKHIAASVLSAVLAGTLAAGALFQTGVSVEASPAMMPGIEKIVSNKTKEQPFRILEIVDDRSEAEIGYYVSGQEPYLKLFQYITTDDKGNTTVRSFRTVEEALSVLPTKESREAFMQNTPQPGSDSSGIKNITALCGSEISGNPLELIKYEETYFPENADEWNRVDFEGEEKRTEKLPGHYEQVNPGEGDYAKGEISYYPVRKDVPSDADKAKFRENIKGFSYSGSTTPESPYLVDFVPVKDEFGKNRKEFTQDLVRDAYDYKNKHYGYYENIYRELRRDTDFTKFPGERDFVPDEMLSAEEVRAEDAFISGDAFDSAPDVEFGDGGDFFADEAVFSEQGYAEQSMEATNDNPQIYRAQQINVFPNYKYIPYKTLEEVKKEANLYQKGDKDFKVTEGMVTYDENGLYRLWHVDDDGAAFSEYLYYVQARQQISPGNIRNLPDDYYGETIGDGSSEESSLVMPYYYQAAQISFECSPRYGGEVTEANVAEHPEAYDYNGWYYAMTPDNEPIYIEDPENATFYASEAEYSLKPGEGNYIFVPGGEVEVPVQVDHLYYKGGYINHDWLKRYVFHLSPEDEDEEVRAQFESFAIEVDTVTKDEYGALAGQTALGLTFEDVPAEEGKDTEFTDSEFIDSEFIDSEFAAAELGDDADSEQEELFGDTAEVEPMISESYEELETAELTEEGFTDAPSEIPEFADETDMAAAFSAGEAEVRETVKLQDYDLIYVNGSLTKEQAAALAELRIPCIVNQNKVDGSKGLKDGFASVMKNDDKDGHYVNQYLYFFRNMQTTNNDKASLVNMQFHTAFYTGEGKVPEGFEEILEYIESENQYRELGAPEGDGFTDGSLQYEALSPEISQARAVEYILNYWFRRPRNLKDCIRVLEIQPANPVGTLREEMVRKWIGTASFINPTACCASSAEPPANLVDGKKDTIWHNNYNASGSTCNHGNPWFTVEIKGNPSDIGGVSYTPRQNNNNNGTAVKYRVEALDRNKQPLNGFTVTGDFRFNTYKDTKQIMFENALPGNAKYIRFSFLNPSNKYASCAEFEPVGKLRVEITTMTSSEFVGHVDDINAKYDLLYFGDDSSAPYYLDLRNGGEVNRVKRLYAHTGSARKYDSGNNKFYTKLLGLLNTDYYSTTQLKHPSVNSNQIGIYRGSGNDITAQQVRELKSFAASGYPVVLADGLVKDGAIRTDTVDSASYMYEFLNGALLRANVLAESEITGNRTLAFYANLAKPQIVFEKGGGLPPEPQRLNAPNYKYNQEASIGTLDARDEGLRFEFRIRNDSEISMANASYNCELYLDLNFDGNMSGEENQASYIQIQEKDTGRVLTAFGDQNGREIYDLKLDTTYILTRKIPEDYFKIITWKLDITSNANANIRTSRTGFTKRKAENRVPIKVLQIQANPGWKDGIYHRNNTWDLKYDPGDKKLTPGTFQYMVAQLQDFEVTVDTATVADYERAYQQNKNYLDSYQMLIIGFADGYPTNGIGADFQNDGAVKAILEFARAGKSVIFTHDTTSFVNWPYPTVSKGNTLYGSNEKIPNVWEWGYPLNRYLRTEVGMDRYGIVSEELSGILKQGKALTSGGSDWNTVKSIASDMAYEYGEPGRSSFMTQGYSNNVLQTNDNCLTTRASKVNEGAITQYPYYIGDMIQTSETHSQYYQLALEQDRNRDLRNDIVVWYCLAKDGDIGDNQFEYSPNDVRNNYYFYSKGNIIYTGVGHSEVSNNSSTIQETQLFVNAIVAAAAVTAVSPDISFVEELNPAARPENVRYYMTNQTNFFSGESNVLEKDMEFYFNVRDYNMVGASLDSTQEIEQKMTVEFYVQDRSGNLYEGAPSDAGALLPLDGEIAELLPYGNGKPVLKDETGKFTLPGNNAYGFHIKDMERYLYENTGAGDYYKNGCKLYAKVTSTVNLYGKPVTSTSWAALDLRQRPLFDMD